MAYRVAINGYGRIGQCLLRAMYERSMQDCMQLVAINELADIETLVYLTRYDTTHGRFPLAVDIAGSQLKIGNNSLKLLNQPDIDALPWQAMDIDLLFECSGSFSSRQQADMHIKQGAKRLLFSQPASPEVDATIVYGINQSQLRSQHQVVSAASCTTNCIIPVLKLIDDEFGIKNGVTTTVHSAMNDQPVIDSYHQTDLRLTRSAMHSIVPVDTGLAKGIDRLLPHLAGKFECLHIRVPVINVSMMDIVINVEKSTNINQVNQLIEAASKQSELKKVLGYTEEPHASIDFNHDSRSAILDGTQTRVSEGTLIKLVCWFDNEWGFVNRMLDTAIYWLNMTKKG